MIWPPLLLADPSACLRRCVLRDLLNRPEDDLELMQLRLLCDADPLVSGLVEGQQPDGSWQPQAFSAGWGAGSRLYATALALARLGYLGFGPTHPTVARGAEFIFAAQQPDGAWPLHRQEDEDGESSERERYDFMPLQTAFPLRGLAACGFATDPRCERAYDWLVAQRLEDGAWPTGWAAGVHGYVAGYRRLAHSRWGCRSNTTGALICLSLHPQRRSGLEAHRALDLLLNRETREREALGYETARLLGAEIPHGFITFFARFDLALLLNLCAQVGADSSDPRVADLVQFVLAQQGAYGLWEYASSPQVSRWVTFDLLYSLARLGENTGWVSAEPRTPFQPYPHRPKRF